MRDKVTIRIYDEEIKKFIDKQSDISFMSRIAIHYLFNKIGMEDISKQRQRIERFGLSNLEKALEKKD